MISSVLVTPVVFMSGGNRLPSVDPTARLPPKYITKKTLIAIKIVISACLVGSETEIVTSDVSVKIVLYS